MASIVFPSDLPYPMVDGYSVSKVDIAKPVDWEAGERRRRQKYRSTPEMLDLSWVFSLSEMALFDSWYEKTLKAGTMEFDIELAGRGTIYEWHTAVFAKDRPYESDFQQGSQNWLVNATLVLLRRVGAIRPDLGLHSINPALEFSSYARLTHEPISLYSRGTLTFGSYAKLRHIESPIAAGVTLSRSVVLIPGFAYSIASFNITATATFVAGSASGVSSFGGTAGSTTLTVTASFISGTASGGVGAARFTGIRARLVALENAGLRKRGA